MLKITIILSAVLFVAATNDSWVEKVKEAKNKANNRIDEFAGEIKRVIQSIETPEGPGFQSKFVSDEYLTLKTDDKAIIAATIAQVPSHYKETLRKVENSKAQVESCSERIQTTQLAIEALKCIDSVKNAAIKSAGDVLCDIGDEEEHLNCLWSLPMMQFNAW